MDEYDQSHYIDCMCRSPEHTMSFTIDDDCIYVHTFLNQQNSVLQRLLIAIKYVFGYKCQYGHFDETILGKKEIEQLKNVIFIHESLQDH